MSKLRKFLNTQPRGTMTAIARKMDVEPQNVCDLARRGIRTMTTAVIVAQAINELYGTTKFYPADLCDKI